MTINKNQFILNCNIHTDKQIIATDPQINPAKRDICMMIICESVAFFKVIPADQGEKMYIYIDFWCVFNRKFN